MNNIANGITNITYEEFEKWRDETIGKTLKDLEGVTKKAKGIILRTKFPGLDHLDIYSRDKLIKEGYICLNEIRYILSGIKTKYTVVIQDTEGFKVFTDIEEREFLELVKFENYNKNDNNYRRMVMNTSVLNQKATQLEEKYNSVFEENTEWQEFFNNIMKTAREMRIAGSITEFNLGHVSEYLIDLIREHEGEQYNKLVQESKNEEPTFTFWKIYRPILEQMNSRGFWTGGDSGNQQIKNWNASVAKETTIFNQLHRFVTKIDKLNKIIGNNKEKNKNKDLKDKIYKKALKSLNKEYTKLLKQFGVDYD